MVEPVRGYSCRNSIFKKLNLYLPISQIVSFNIFRPGEFTKNNLIFTFNYFFFINIILSEQAQRVRHDYKLLPHLRVI